MALAPPHSLVSPSTCFTIACVAFSVFAISMAVRRQNNEPSVENAKSSVGATSRQRLVADDAVLAQPNVESRAKPAVQSSPSDVLAELLSRLDQILGLAVERMSLMERPDGHAAATLLKEISLTMAAASHLHPLLGRSNHVMSTRPDFFALISATLSSLRSAVAGVETDLSIQTGDQALSMRHAIEQLGSQRLALQFLSNNISEAATPPTPPPEALLNLRLERPKSTASNANDYLPLRHGLTPSTETKNWIEPPPKYSPPVDTTILRDDEKVNREVLRGTSPSSSARASLGSSGENRLYEAVSENDRGLLVQLLDEDANPNAFASDLQRTPLHLAAQLNLCDCIQILLRSGADMTVEDCKGDMPLHLAAWAGNVEALNVILAHGADVDSLSGRDGYSPLWCAIDASQIDAARLLLKYGARVSSRAASGDGRLPLHQAAIMGQSAMCELLLERGALVDPMDDERNTPLHYAAASGSTSTVKALLRAGADIHMQQSQGLTPLHWAAHKGHSSVATALLDHGADVDAETNNGVVPLHLAANAGHRQIIRVLLARRADRAKKATCWDGNYGTPYEMAMAKRYKTVASLLKV